MAMKLVAWIIVVSIAAVGGVGTYLAFACNDPTWLFLPVAALIFFMAG